MKPFSIKSIILGIIIATLMCLRGKKKKSLSASGSATAFVVGFTSIACGARGFLLLVFYQLGTMITKIQNENKIKKDGDVSKSSVRSPYQVLACSGIAVLISLIHAFYCGEEISISKFFYQFMLVLVLVYMNGKEISYVKCLIFILFSELKEIYVSTSLLFF
jgi:uncharacterized membrane protein